MAVNIFLSAAITYINLTDLAANINTIVTENIANKIQIFKEKTKTRKSIFVTFVTAFGLLENEYKLSRVQSEIKIEDLFK